MSQAPRNEAQEAAYHGYLELCSSIITWLISINCVILPWSLYASSINTLHHMISINNFNAHVYIKDNKIGSAGTGCTRLIKYKEGLLGENSQLSIYSLIDIDNLPEWVQRLLTPMMIHGVLQS